MKTILTGAVLVTLAGFAPARAQDDGRVPARGVSAGGRITLTVQAVDVDRREITLKGPKGSVGTYSVGEHVKRLAEIKPGDTLVADYRLTALVELREPTEEEKAKPVVLSSEIERDPVDRAPRGILRRTIRSVAHIDSVDRFARTFTLRGPLGALVHVQVDESTPMVSLQPGKAIVATYIEALALAIDPSSGDRVASDAIPIRGVAAGFRRSFQVLAVDREARLIVLQAPGDKIGVYRVDEAVKRLHDIKAGDTLLARIWVAAVAELREPTAEEQSAPITLSRQVARATLAGPPAGALERSIRVVCPIEAVDKEEQDFQVQSPLGGKVQVHVDDPRAFNSLEVGKAIVMTFSEVVMLSIDPK